MEILNPKFTSDIPAGLEAQRARVLQAVQNFPTSERAFSFDAVREALGKTDEELPDGWIHQICTDAGLAVVP
jgi:hypothetical protein